jgi:hypothetical protein
LRWFWTAGEIWRKFLRESCPQPAVGAAPYADDDELE